ncbi:MAG: hypothetical protein FJ291_16320 [Planctomycetes bacterium]|nr:hypothetical protein [Planctomycetota bacterium]
MPEDFWPNIRLSKHRMPVGILREQASLLGRKTRNVVTAKVVSYQEGKVLAHDLQLVAPALGHYTYLALTVQHPISLYPMRIIDHLRNDNLLKASTEDQFRAILKEILSSHEMKRVVEVLLAQSESAKPKMHPTPPRAREPFVKEPLPPVSATRRG